MNFLVPAFLAGLGALSIPVLIHMINRERKTVVQFPSLMFLHKIPYRSVRRQKIRHLLLLLLRCLALALIVAAFARPFLKKDPSVTAGTGARDVVIAIDRSYSMAYGTRFKRAQDAARDVVHGLGANDRARVITFTTEPDAVPDETQDRGRLEAAIANAKVSSEGTRYVPVIKLGGQLLSASSLPRKELVLISDYQQAGWAKREEVTIPPGVTLTPMDVGDVSSSDAAVIGVTTSRDQDTTRTHLTVSARVTNVAAKERTTDAVLEIGGRPVETKHITIPARGAAQVEFAPVPVPGEATRGMVRITEDSLPPDDRFHFTIAADEAISVLVVQPAGARSMQSLFFERALGIGDHPKFRVDRVFEGDLKASDLDRRSLVVLNEATPPSGQLGARLRDLVTSGAGLLIVPGENSVGSWSAEWRAFIPVTVGPVVDRLAEGGATIGAVDYSNPVFEIFSAPRSGDFSAVHVWRYRTLAAKGDSGVVARFDDGSPAMVIKEAGAGRVAVWGTTLDNYWTDFPTQGGVYLPFVHQLGKHIGRYTDAKGWFTAGDILDLTRHAEITAPLLGKGTRSASDSGELVLEAPSGEKTRLSATGTNHLAPLHESGFYELRTPSTPVGGGRPIAVNVDPAEADLSHLDPKELVAAATAVAPGAAGKGTDAVGTPAEQERRQTVWWYLLLAALVLLAAETVMSNRLSRVASI